MRKLGEILVDELHGLFVVSLFGIILGISAIVISIMVDNGIAPIERYTGVMAITGTILLVMSTWIFVVSILETRKNDQ